MAGIGPDGFAWGYYGGADSAQLALALLLYFYDEETACANYQDFKWDMIASLPYSDWEMDFTKIQDWMMKREIEREIE